MAKTNIDTARLFAVLESRVNAENISWRQAAGKIGVSPSLLSRLRNNQRPDLDAYAAIVGWLGMSADDFISTGTVGTERKERELSTEVSALLRARSDLTDTDKTLLEEVFRSALKAVQNREQSGAS